MFKYYDLYLRKINKFNNMKQEEIEKIKCFLDLYNPQRTVEMALTSGIKAAAQHNSLYTPNIDNKSEILDYWKSQLQCIGVKYFESQQTEEQFKSDFLLLQSNMNTMFPKAFKSKQYVNNPGFRISHAQKSLSVYLKHMWCIKVEQYFDNKSKNIVPEYPICPMDRTILRLVNCPNPKWVHINTMDEYNEKLEFIKTAAKKENKSLAMWELMAF